MSEVPGEAGQTFRLVLEYDGAAFEGWQAQAGERPARTVQGVLGEALESITGSPGRIRGAGRTDAGVHAVGQVASVRVETGLAAEALRRALNAQLPEDLAVCVADAVPAGWDALREAQGKTYRYQIWNGRGRSPLRAARWYWVRERLDCKAMETSAGFLGGRHDFKSFQGAGSAVKTTVRRLESIRIAGEAGAEITFEVMGEGFLRHMVRNLVGTLVEVGRGRWQPEAVREILEAADRRVAGPTAPAHGLCLMAVRDSWSEASAADRARPK